MPRNPYEPSRVAESGHERSALPYFLSAGLLLAIAITLSAPGIALLNRLPVPGRYATYDSAFTLFGRSVPAATIMGWSLGIGAVSFLATIALFVTAVRLNRSTRRRTH